MVWLLLLLQSDLDSISISISIRCSFGIKQQQQKKCDTFSICACHPCAGAMLIFSVSFQFLRMTGCDPGSDSHTPATHTQCTHTKRTHYTHGDTSPHSNTCSQPCCPHRKHTAPQTHHQTTTPNTLTSPKQTKVTKVGAMLCVKVPSAYSRRCAHSESECAPTHYSSTVQPVQCSTTHCKQKRGASSGHDRQQRGAQQRA